jgi:DNA polymerase III delta prime subunit
METQNNKPTIEEQKSVLRAFAFQNLNKGLNSEEVNENLKNVVVNLNYCNEINVDAIIYLAKQDLGLIK